MRIEITMRWAAGTMVILGSVGCASDETEPVSSFSPLSAEAASYGERESSNPSGKRELLPLPPEMRNRMVLSKPSRGHSWGTEARTQAKKAPAPSSPRTVAVLGSGEPLERNSLFPRDEHAELSDVISLTHEPMGQGTLARSGRVVAGDEDVVFQAGDSGQLDLLRPPEAALSLDRGSHLYGEAFRGGDKTASLE
jgi:hypothetical protein